ncbi:MAG: adenosine kinase [Rhodospirillaceae bacterium]|nr:MAG: adenosine kinase [Rhodospirillaceae bacterium]
MTEVRYDVVGIGSAIVDILSNTNDDFIAAQNMVKGTMSLITAEQAEALYDRMGRTVEICGGSAANTMVGLASLGGLPAFIGKVGKDKLGKLFSHEITASGVDFHGGPTAATLATALSMILVTPDAQRTMNTYLGASTELSPDDIDPKLIAAAHLTYIEGYQWDAPGAKAAIRKASKAARAAGRQVALSLSDPFVVERHGADLIQFVREGVDILFGNEEEIRRLTGQTDFNMIVAALRGAMVLTCVTRGAKGAVVVDGETVTEIPAAPVTRVVDTTGAGDLFAAGFLYGYTHGRDTASCTRIGALAAAEVISHMGARPEISLRELLEARGL